MRPGSRVVLNYIKLPPGDLRFLLNQQVVVPRTGELAQPKRRAWPGSPRRFQASTADGVVLEATTEAERGAPRGSGRLDPAAINR